MGYFDEEKTTGCYNCQLNYEDWKCQHPDGPDWHEIYDYAQTKGIPHPDCPLKEKPMLIYLEEQDT